MLTCFSRRRSTAFVTFSVCSPVTSALKLEVRFQFPPKSIRNCRSALVSGRWNGARSCLFTLVMYKADSDAVVDGPSPVAVSIRALRPNRASYWLTSLVASDDGDVCSNRHLSDAFDSPPRINWSVLSLFTECKRLLSCQIRMGVSSWFTNTYRGVSRTIFVYGDRKPGATCTVTETSSTLPSLQCMLRIENEERNRRGKTNGEFQFPC